MDSNKVALVTGAGRGIGRGIALGLADRGFAVAGLGISFDPGNREKGLFEVEDRFREKGRPFFPVQADIADLDCHDRVIEAIFSQTGRLDLLVNNAGVAPLERKDILETGAESYDRVMGINARGPFFFSQKVAARMIKQSRQTEFEAPKIIFITSVSARVSSPNRPEYCISKAALSMTATLFADRLSKYGIGVYEIRPGIVQTDMTRSVKEKYDRLIDEGLIPQKRWGRPDDVAAAVISLAEGSFDYATGAVFELSGGLNIRRL